MIQQFEGSTADELWRKTAKALQSAGDRYSRQDSRLGPMREYLHCSLHLHNPIQRWVLSRRPAMNPAFAIAEVVWLLSGRDDAAFVNYWNPLLPEFAGHGETYHGAYGNRIRRSFGFDQMERAYQVLSANPSSRQVVLQIWSSNLDSPNPDGTARSPDIPCNIVAMPKVRDGKLEWLQVMRSNDVFLGTPHNFVQFTSLQEILAGWLGIGVGSFVLVSDSLHLYEHDLEQCAITVDSPTALNTDTLALSKNEFDRVLPIVENAMDDLRGIDMSRDRFVQVIDRIELPMSWRNLLCIAAADVARRRSWPYEMRYAANRCTNPALSAAWDAWLARCSSKQSLGSRSAESS